MSGSETFDVVIVGGAVTGSSIACHLGMDPAFRGRILVIEKDASYANCASARSAASIRQQFSTAANIAISLYGIEFLREIGARLEVAGDRPEIDLVEGGYLFLATPAGRTVLEENHALQTRLGADIAFLEPDDLRREFPWLMTDDLAAGCFGRTGEGWFDGYGLMRAFRAKARALGAEYRAAKVASIAVEAGRAIGVVLADGTAISAGTVVVAAGIASGRLAASAGIELPISPRKRMIFPFDCADVIAPRCPLLVDPTGAYVRAEGKGFICGAGPAEDADPENDPDDPDFEVEHDFFEETLWPILAARVPAFERLRLGRPWAGHYDMNLFDHNALLGPWPGLENLHFACGFSGHGLQQSPAVGRGIAELVVHGAFRTLDLADLATARLVEGRRVAERNVV
ncbi:NAD(P)/FAD-dependent oxidoreductase [Methylobrevis albus]|uniref:NAD(P)/FAD-dependent oxidoreductase n=1 Tax=Methylobrevis albus TaxID=2793297 RepID=UPI002E2E71CA|nr:FAD-binding oxidoreductase [Methylobrevis albus]